MIHSRKELLWTIKIDSKCYPTVTSGFFNKWLHILASTPNSTQYSLWKYVKCLRYCEYYYNNSIVFDKSISGFIFSIAYVYSISKLRRLAYKTGIQIPPNVFGEGLQIYHFGSIVVNQLAKVGKNAVIYPGVVIGSKGDKYPVIGDNCFIGAGSKILGGVTIGNNVTIAPNAVVVKDVPDNVVVGGIPCKIIKYKGL